MDVSVVIPTHNRAPLLWRTVTAFLAQEGVRFELIVVDDGSTDHTPQVLAQLKDERLQVLRQPNQGLSAARNAGFSRASGRLVLFNDDDLVPEAGFLRAHLELHRHFPSAAAVSHTYLPPWLGQHPFIRYWRQRAEGGVRGRPDAAPLGRGGFWFASLSLPKEVLPPRPFTEFAGYGWEEHELGLRLWQQGIRPRLARHARAAHEDAVSLEGMLLKYRSMGRTAWQFYRRHPSLQVALWTGANPVSLVFKRWAYPWTQAQKMLEDRAWEQGGQAHRAYRFLLEAAYTQGLLEGQGG